MANDQTLLRKPIASLALGEELKRVTEMLGFNTLEELSRRSTAELRGLPGFSLHLLYEYVNFMESNGFGELVDPL